MTPRAADDGVSVCEPGLALPSNCLDGVIPL
jgi:hypothetical protein